VPLLGETVVTGTRTPAHLRDVPASVSIVTRRDIEETHATRVEELLLTLPGVDQAQPLSGGAPGAPRLRGLPGTFAGATTLVLVDGMPVEPVLINNRQAWLLVAPQNVERLEVVRGPASVLYGPSAAGGVINIITRSGRGAPFAEVSGGYGSHETYQLGLGGGGTLAKVVDVMVGGTLYHTGGYRPWPETPARWAPYYPSGLNDLDGRDSEDKTLQVRLGVRPSEHHEVSVAYRYFDVGGAWLGGHPNYRWSRHGGLADLGYRWRPAEAFELKARVQRSEFNNRVRYDSNALNGDGVLDLAEAESEREQAWHGDLQLDLRLLAGNVFTVGGSWEEGELTGRTFDNLGVETGVRSGRSQVLAVYAQDQQRLLGDLLVLQGGGRFDRYRFSADTRDGSAYPGSSDDVYNYRAGLRVNPARGTSLYGSTGTAYLPALNTLKYRRPGGPWLDNPGLAPERSVSYEVGGTQELARRTSVTLSLFQTVYRDKITVAQVGAQRQYQNLAEVRVKGLEAAAETSIVHHLRGFANYTLTDAEIGKDPSAPATEGMRPAYTPKHKAGAGVVYSDPRFVTARVAGRWVGAQYSRDTNAADTHMSSFLTVDARVARALSLGASRELVLSVAADNVLDRRYVEWNDELADGRRFWVELALKM
jgi:outer membrane receptor protein involved in Fe transport